MNSMPQKPTIAVIGAGAVGGYYGGRLAQHGHEVHFLLRGDFDAWRRRGLSVRSIRGDFHIPPAELRIYKDAAAMPAVDLAIVTLKSTANSNAARLLSPIVRNDTIILALQNGLGNEPHLAEHFNPRNILGAIAFACINRIEPAVIHHIDHGLIVIGEFASAGVSNRVAGLVEMFQRSNIEAAPVADLRRARWEKLVWNIPFNGLSALLDTTTDQLISTEAGVRLVRAVMDEVITVARADGVDLSPDVAEAKLALTRTMGAYIPSTLSDRRARRPMEIGAIFGKPLDIARIRNLHTPLLELLHFSLSRLDVS